MIEFPTCDSRIDLPINKQSRAFNVLIAYSTRTMAAKAKKKAPIKLSTDLLVELGYEKLTQQQANELLSDFYKTLETIVGVELGSRMDEEQMDAFSKFFDAGDETGAFKWLERNFEDYRDIVDKAFGKLKAELRDVSGEA
jgi:Protein of unknown function (DUF5663)